MIKKEFFLRNAKETRYTGAAFVALSFFLPLLLLFFGLVFLGITPFGAHSLGISDGGSYIAGLNGMGQFLRKGGNMLYSLGGMGNNAWVGWAWGGISFGHLLSVFATPENAPVIFSCVCLTNLSLCGLTMYLLLAYLRGPRVENLIFSTAYALCGFNVGYCYHYLFFIGVQMLPLMMMGLLKLVRGRSPLLYTLSLALCIFLNFYFGFFLCVCSVVVFLALLAANREAWKGRIVRIFLTYTFSSLIAGFLAAPMWLPALKALSGGGRITQATKSSIQISENMPFLQMFAKLFSGANSRGEQVNGMPFIFCGIAAVALVILYYLNPDIAPRRKRISAAVLLFYLLSFYFYPFTRLMHGGAQTNWFNYRYSFIFSFLLLLIALEEFVRLERCTNAELKRCGLILLLSAILIFSTRYEFIGGGEVLLDLALLAVMWLLFRVYQSGKYGKRAFTWLLLLAVSVNLLANFCISTRKVESMEMDLEGYTENLVLTGSTIDALKTYDPSFFRMEKDVSESGSIATDAGLYGYNGISANGPTVRAFLHTGANKLGLNWYDMRHWYSDGVTAATDALFGLKYILATRDLAAEKGYELLLNNTASGVANFDVYANPNCLPIAILSEDGITGVELGNNAFENLNTVWKAMTGGEKDIFTPVEDIVYTLHNPTDSLSVTSEELRFSASGTEEETKKQPRDKAWIEMEFPAKRDGTVYRFDTSVPDSENGSETPSVKCVGYYHTGKTVKDTSTANAEIATQEDFLNFCGNIVYASADNSVLEEYAAQLKGRDISFNIIEPNDLTGTFTAEKGQRILFTLNWDEGWSCYIDGQKVPIDKTWDLFMSVEVPEGQHTWELKFFPVWLDYGLYLGGAALLGLVVLMVWWKRNRVEAQSDDAASNGTDRERVPDTQKETLP